VGAVFRENFSSYFLVKKMQGCMHFYCDKLLVTKSRDRCGLNRAHWREGEDVKRRG